MLTDSHCHLASHRFEMQEREAIIQRAIDNGVTRMVTLSTCLEDMDANLELAGHPAVHAAIGIHPCDVHEAPDDAVSQIGKRLDDPRVCALGETGLDYFHPAPEGWSDEDYRQRQRRFLESHFKLAAACVGIPSLKLPVVIHTRDRSGDASFRDALEIYRKYHEQVCAVFHCFVGPWENAKQVIELGGLVSFGGVTTFKNAKEVLETACQCPAGSFMLETDSPYLAPVPHRGERNQPAWVRDIAEHLAEARGESLEQLAEHTSKTVDSFFRIPFNKS
ncbi:MAG: TatD family hydrolase [Akkermansiaceae bacterium]|nr:TatD family hydrolase [Akkermansiaceae bacterium]